MSAEIYGVNVAGRLFARSPSFNNLLFVDIYPSRPHAQIGIAGFGSEVQLGYQGVRVIVTKAVGRYIIFSLYVVYNKALHVASNPFSNLLGQAVVCHTHPPVGFVMTCSEQLVVASCCCCPTTGRRGKLSHARVSNLTHAHAHTHAHMSKGGRQETETVQECNILHHCIMFDSRYVADRYADRRSCCTGGPGRAYVCMYVMYVCR